MAEETKKEEPVLKVKTEVKDDDSKASSTKTAPKTQAKDPDIEVIISNFRFGNKINIKLNTGRTVSLFKQLGKGDLVTEEEADWLVEQEMPVCCKSGTREILWLKPFSVVI